MALLTTRRAPRVCVAAPLLLFLLPVPATPQTQLLLNQPIGLIAVDASPTPNVLVTLRGGSGLFRSSDGGLNWSASYLRPAGQPQPVISELLADIINSGVIYAGTTADDGGVWKSTDGGVTWSTVNDGLPGGGVQGADLAQVPASPLTLYARFGAQIFKTTDGGQKWTLQSTLPFVPNAFAVAPSNPRLMFAADNVGIHRSLDEGATWPASALSVLGGGAGDFVTSIAVDAGDPNFVYAGVAGNAPRGNGIYRSTDGGVVFNLALSPGFSLQPAYLYAHPALALIYSSDITAPCLHTNTNRTTSFALQSCIGNGTGPVRLAFDPRRPAVWAATSQGPYFSNNLGFPDSAGRSTWLSRFGFVKPTLATPAAAYEFSLTPGQVATLELPVRVVETDRFPVPVSVTTTGEPWLGVIGVTGTTPFTATVRVDAGGLVAGIYNATINVASAQVTNSTMSIPVKLTVRAADADQTYVIDTYAGNGQAVSLGDGSAAVQASLSNVDSLAADLNGNLYLSESSTNRIRRIASDRIIRKFAGTGTYDDKGDGGDPQLAAFRAPRGLAVDAFGRLLVADSSNNRIRQIDNTTITAFSLGMPTPRGIALGPDGTLYVALPTLHAIVRVPSSGSQAILFAGNGLAGFRGDGGRADLARLSAPSDVAVDAQGNVFIADTANSRIRVVGTDGKIRTVAGNGLSGFQGDSAQATSVALARPQGIAVDAAGNVIIADTDNHRIRLLGTDGSLRTIAGTGEAGFGGDQGPGTRALLRSPVDVAAGAGGVIYVADGLNFRIRRLSPEAPAVVPQISTGGIVSIFAGPSNTTGLAPGAVFSIYGINFASSAQKASTTPWPDSLGGISVTINGRPVPLQFAGSNQINGQVPYETEAGASAWRVVRDGVESSPISVPITTAAPSLVAVVNQDGRVNTPTVRALSGSFAVLYLSGAGALDIAIPNGAAAPPSPLSRAALPATLRINEREIPIAFLGMSPNSVGLGQLNFQVPFLPQGSYPLTLTIDGVTSNQLLFSVAGSN